MALAPEMSIAAVQTHLTESALHLKVQFRESITELEDKASFPIDSIAILGCS
jgi:hypothetical protein